MRNDWVLRDYERGLDRGIRRVVATVVPDYGGKWAVLDCVTGSKLMTAFDDEADARLWIIRQGCAPVRSDEDTISFLENLP